MEPSAPGPWTDVTLAILAGGKGRRLGGVPKGLLRFEGKTVLEHLIALGSSFSEVLLVADDPSPYAGYAVRAVGDVLRHRGAPGGVHAALMAAHTPWVMVVACDMPFVRGEFLEALLGARKGGAEAVCFELSGRLEPLVALYKKELAGRFEPLLEKEPSLQALLRSCRLERLGEQTLKGIEGGLQALCSVNTPEDAAKFGVLPPASPNSSP